MCNEHPVVREREVGVSSEAETNTFINKLTNQKDTKAYHELSAECEDWILT